MKIISTFNDKLYEFSGKEMIRSARAKIPDAEIIIYQELNQNTLDLETVDVDNLPEVKKVLEENTDIISTPFGGLADKDKMTMWNARWFGWFKKIAMGYHATCVKQHKGYLLFVDSDIRFLSHFDERFIDRATLGKSISYFRGNRSVAETGFIIVKADDLIVQDFYKYYIELFLSKKFRDFPRWDDSYAFENSMHNFDQKHFCDLAAGHLSNKHTNSNGHTTNAQIIAFTEWGEYVEHDKGIHWRNNLVPQPE
jgi:hypothetical protein